MSAPEVLESAEEAPTGCHVLSFYAGPAEAARHAAEFLHGAPDGQTAQYWVANRAGAEFYAAAAGDRAPSHVGCVAILPTEQVELVEGRLRPVGEIRRFLASHPEGVSAGADTISLCWGAEDLDAHLEYERWFQAQPRSRSRFLCPYDVHTVPPGDPVSTVRELAAHHTHLVLSDSDEPGVRLLQLFVFATAPEVPAALAATLDWATREGLVALEGSDQTLTLTPEGEHLVREWGDRSSIG